MTCPSCDLTNGNYGQHTRTDPDCKEYESSGYRYVDLWYPRADDPDSVKAAEDQPRGRAGRE